MSIKGNGPSNYLSEPQNENEVILIIEQQLKRQPQQLIHYQIEHTTHFARTLVHSIEFNSCVHKSTNAQ